MIGRVLGPYRVVDKIGEGGMGEVLVSPEHRFETVAESTLHTPAKVQ